MTDATNGYHGEKTSWSDNGAGSTTPRVVPSEPNPLFERRYAQIIGWGYHVPEKIVTNKDLEQIVDTTDEWIRTRTGIEQRHVAADPAETTASLGIIAAAPRAGGGRCAPKQS